MPETNKQHRERVFRHRGRSSQVPIFLGKQLRFFINESDWKVLPMAAVIAGLVSMVIRNKLFINMEGTLMGAFAMVCVSTRSSPAAGNGRVSNGSTAPACISHPMSPRT